VKKTLFAQRAHTSLELPPNLWLILQPQLTFVARYSMTGHSSSSPLLFLELPEEIRRYVEVVMEDDKYAELYEFEGNYLVFGTNEAVSSHKKYLAYPNEIDGQLAEDLLEGARERARRPFHTAWQSPEAVPEIFVGSLLGGFLVYIGLNSFKAPMTSNHWHWFVASLPLLFAVAGAVLAAFFPIRALWDRRKLMAAIREQEVPVEDRPLPMAPAPKGATQL
jgi:hypothetical protein